MTGDHRAFLLDPANWDLSDPNGIPHQILTHLQICAVALLVSAVVAIPLGLLIGHTRRGAFLAINLGNAWRSLPTFGLLSLLVTLIGIGDLPVQLALVALAIPPLLLGTYAGVLAVDPDVVDAALGVGLSGRQVLWQVEAPIALPLVIGGLRSATLQVISTATIAAYVGSGGLGRFLVDGLALGAYDEVLAGAVLVAALAILADLALGAAGRLAVSPGLSRRHSAGASRSRTSAPATPVPQA